MVDKDLVGKMSEFKSYIKPAEQKMRPYVKGEDMTGISVGEGVKVGLGGMIAIDEANPTDMWYIPKDFFKKNYVESSKVSTGKSLGNTDVDDAKKNVSDLVTFGDGDTFQLLCKASSKAEGWMKSTKAMEIPGVGCVVQVTTQQGTNVSEALTFVPGVCIVAVVPGNPEAGRKLGKIR